MFGRIPHVESKHRICAPLCYLSNTDISQYVTQNSSCTRQFHNLFISLIVKQIQIQILYCK